MILLIFVVFVLMVGKFPRQDASDEAERRLTDEIETKTRNGDW